MNAAWHQLLLHHPLALAGKIDNRRGLLTATARCKHSENQPLQQTRRMTKNTPDTTHAKVVAVALCATRTRSIVTPASRFAQRRELQQILRVLPCSSWLISPASIMSDERKTLEQRATMTDIERSAAFGIACTCNRDSENLAGSAVRCRAAGREWFLLRCRSSAPHFA